MTSPIASAAGDIALLKHAQAMVRESRERMEQLQDRLHGSIAVVGRACRFPGGCDDVDAYWQLLMTGRHVASDVPQGRWRQQGEPQVAGWGKGAFLTDVDAFDADFFRIPAREALSMDPQHRLLMGVVHQALEDAGLDAASLAGSRTGVFVGMMCHDYSEAGYLDASLINPYTATGNGGGIAAGRIAHFFALEGPALTIDTNCSSSLVALHLACQSLRLGECDRAIVCGVNLMLSPLMHTVMGRAGALSASGRCHAFDDNGDGYGRGEGCGALVLTRLTDALRDRGQILALVRGSAVNNNGRSSALPVPRGSAQEKVIREALRAARVEARDVSYVEAHGTGTALGDPIEIDALAGAFRGRHPDQPLLVGACKANIGHLEAASGMASLIKAIEIARLGVVPPQPGPVQPTRHVQWASIPVRLATKPMTLSAEARSRLLGVSGFGLCGTNAHVVLQGHSVQRTDEDGARAPAVGYVLPVSGRDAAAVFQLLDHYRALLSAADGAPQVRSLCCTAATGRTHFRWRLGLVGSTVEELLAAIDAARLIEPAQAGGLRRRVILELGASSAAVDATALFAAYSEFRSTFTQSASEIERLAGVQIGPAGLKAESAQLVSQPVAARLARHCTQVALGALLASLGVCATAIRCTAETREAAQVLARACTPIEGIAGLLARLDVVPRLHPLGSLALHAEIPVEELADNGSTKRPEELILVRLDGAPVADSISVFGAGACAAPATRTIGASVALNPAAVALFYAAGIDLDWRALYPAGSYEFCPARLPKYPLKKAHVGRISPAPTAVALTPINEPTLGVRQRSSVSDVDAALQEVLGAVREVLQEDQVAPTPDTRVGELGLDSLALVDMAASLREKLGVELAPGQQTLGLSLREIAALATRRPPETGAPPRTTARASLVALQDVTGTAGATAVMVHPVGGGIWPYVNLLGGLRPEVRLLAIEAVSADHTVSIEELASSYLELVRPRREGKLILGGWSMGGYVAYEMARQLHEATGEAAPVLLIDSVWQAFPTLPGHAASATALALFALDLGIPIESLGQAPMAGLDTDRALAQLATLVGQLRQTQPMNPALLRNRFALFTRNLDALLDYRIGSYSGHVELIMAKQGLGRISTDIARTDWQAYAASLNLNHVDADHFSIMRKPAVDHVSAALDYLLGANEATSPQAGVLRFFKG